jgi:hypothetical protein
METGNWKLEIGKLKLENASHQRYVISSFHFPISSFQSHAIQARRESANWSSVTRAVSRPRGNSWGATT